MRRRKETVIGLHRIASLVGKARECRSSEVRWENVGVTDMVGAPRWCCGLSAVGEVTGGATLSHSSVLVLCPLLKLLDSCVGCPGLRMAGRGLVSTVAQRRAGETWTREGWLDFLI